MWVVICQTHLMSAGQFAWTLTPDDNAVTAPTSFAGAGGTSASALNIKPGVMVTDRVLWYHGHGVSAGSEHGEPAGVIAQHEEQVQRSS